MFFKYNFNSIAWGLLIFILSAVPGNDFPDLSFWSLLSFDKVIHAFFYAVFVIFLIVGFIKQYSFPRLRYGAVPCALITGIAYGGTIEFLQYSVFAQRNGDIFDFIANTVGCFIGMLLFYIIYGKNIAASR